MFDSSGSPDSAGRMAKAIVRSTILSPAGSFAPFFTVAIATGAFVPENVRSLDTTGDVTAVATPAIASTRRPGSEW